MFVKVDTTGLLAVAQFLWVILKKWVKIQYPGVFCSLSLSLIKFQTNKRLIKSLKIQHHFMRKNILPMDFRDVVTREAYEKRSFYNFNFKKFSPVKRVVLSLWKFGNPFFALIIFRTAHLSKEFLRSCNGLSWQFTIFLNIKCLFTEVLFLRYRLKFQSIFEIWSWCAIKPVASIIKPSRSNTFHRHCVNLNSQQENKHARSRARLIYRELTPDWKHQRTSLGETSVRDCPPKLWEYPQFVGWFWHFQWIFVVPHLKLG